MIHMLNKTDELVVTHRRGAAAQAMLPCWAAEHVALFWDTASLGQWAWLKPPRRNYKLCNIHRSYNIEEHRRPEHRRPLSFIVFRAMLVNDNALCYSCTVCGLNLQIHSKYIEVINTSPLDKMATISQMTFSNSFSWMKNVIFRFEFYWFVPKGPIDEKSVCVHVMAWCWTGDKPFLEPMLTQLTDAYMRD